MNNLIELFEQWLIQNGITTTDKSNASYMRRLRKAFQIWNQRSKVLVKIEDNLNVLQTLAIAQPDLFDTLFNLMIRYVCEEHGNSMIGEGYRNDINTAIRRFEEFLKSTAAINNNSNSNSAPTLRLISSVNLEYSSNEEFFPEELNLRNRIASRDSTHWPARKLGKLIGNTRADSWITKVLKKAYVLTEAGPHRVIDIEKMRIGQGDILEVKPKIYPQATFVKAYGYHANGTIHPLKVARDSNGAILLSSITLDHSPAISLIIKSGQFPEFLNLINGKTVNAADLKKEFNLINDMELYLLMERGENSSKKDRW